MFIVFDQNLNILKKIFFKKMIKKNPDVDIVDDVLRLTLAAYPSSSFVKSLLFQYHERGSLSRSQLEGLYSKASKVTDMPPGKMATLQAIILKKPVRDRTPVTKTITVDKKDEHTRQMIDAILNKNPTHKMVLILKSKFDNKEILTPTEKTDLERFYSKVN